MIRNYFLTAVILTGFAGTLDAQPFPRIPYPPAPQPQAQPGQTIEGTWYFRGDPTKPCIVQTAQSLEGPTLLFTNEKNSPAYARLSRDGRWVNIPAWNTTGTVRWNRIIWPDGDFWAR